MSKIQGHVHIIMLMFINTVIMMSKEIVRMMIRIVALHPPAPLLSHWLTCVSSSCITTLKNAVDVWKGQ